LSDDSGDGPLDASSTEADLSGDIPEAIAVPNGNIPAVKKRNKMNLLMIDSIISVFGSYQFLSELGPKGEGAIQTIKPIVKKLGGLMHRDWPLHIGKSWFSRRFSKTVVAMAVEALSEAVTSSGVQCTSEEVSFFEIVTQSFSQFLQPQPACDPLPPQGTTDNNIDDISDVLPGVPLLSVPGGMDSTSLEETVGVVCSGDAPPSKRMFTVYKSRQRVIDVMADPTTPVSVVVLMPDTDASKIWYAAAYDDADLGRTLLLQVFPSHYVTESFGAAFFQWEARPSSAPRLLAGCSVSDYALLLPMNATLSGETATVHYCVTYWWMELLKNGTLGYFRLDQSNFVN
jgi:hypothetical protein